MKLNIFIKLLTVLTITVWLTACGGSGGGDSPDAQWDNSNWDEKNWQ